MGWSGKRGVQPNEEIWWWRVRIALDGPFLSRADELENMGTLTHCEPEVALLWIR